MKEKWEQAQIEVIEFANEDVITTSTPGINMPEVPLGQE